MLIEERRKLKEQMSGNNLESKNSQRTTATHNYGKHNNKSRKHRKTMEKKQLKSSSMGKSVSYKEKLCDHKSPEIEENREKRHMPSKDKSTVNYNRSDQPDKKEAEEIAITNTKECFHESSKKRNRIKSHNNTNSVKEKLKHKQRSQPMLINDKDVVCEDENRATTKKNANTRTKKTMKITLDCNTGHEKQLGHHKVQHNPSKQAIIAKHRQPKECENSEDNKYSQHVTKSIIKKPDSEGWPAKTFLQEEIMQMKRFKKLPPPYKEPPQYNEKFKGGVKVLLGKGKSVLWKPITANTAEKELSAYPLETPRIKIDQLPASSSTSSISSKLMKLREETKETSRKNMQSHREQTRSQHKVLHWQRSLPADISPTGNLQTMKETNNFKAEMSDYIFKESKEEDITKENSLNRFPQEVVFRMDLDEIANKQPQKKGFSSFFRRKVIRGKSLQHSEVSSQTEPNTKTAAMQVKPWQVEDFHHTIGTQTEILSTKTTVTQTCPGNKNVHTQTGHKMKVAECQVQPSTQDIETQTMPILVDAEVQTYEEHLDGGVSLDQLVRMRRRARSVTEREGHAKKKTEIKQCKRSATLPNSCKSNQNDRISPFEQPIASFNWSQTEKFVKVFISHSGIHLLPANKIHVKTNGLDLRLRIEECQEEEKRNSNHNNNVSVPQNKELYIPRLCHPVTSVSYTIQADMMTLLLRKRSIASWNKLQYDEAKTMNYV